MGAVFKFRTTYPAIENVVDLLAENISLFMLSQAVVLAGDIFKEYNPRFTLFYRS